MKIKVDNKENALELIKESMWLAWNESVIFGRGALRDQPRAKKDAVWENIYNRLDYPNSSDIQGFNESDNGKFSADYVFGRCMKIYCIQEDDTITIPNTHTLPDYQTWCKVYPSYKDLFLKASENMNIQIKEIT